MVKVLHITTHLGGGIGKALAHISIDAKRSNSKYEHRMLLLEKPEKARYVEMCEQGDVSLSVAPSKEEIKQELDDADIVVLNWTHHPAMMKLLNEFPQVAVRLVLWSHVNGCNYPNIPFEFISRMHRTFFATYYSFDNPNFTIEQKQQLKTIATTIYGLGQLSLESENCKGEHSKFTIGYVGTLSFSKLNPNFAEYCRAVLDKIPNASFVVVGDSNNSKLISQLSELEILDKFDFVGFTDDVSCELKKFDVFGYPLNPNHFGATENAILEAMAEGVPVVALRQSAENYLIQHGHTGYLAGNPAEYAAWMVYLHENRSERKRLTLNAQNFIKREFSFELNIKKMHENFSEVMEAPKRIYEFRDIFGEEPYLWFMKCLGAEKGLFEESARDFDSEDLLERIKNCQPILVENGKGSVLHYAGYYPEDRYLARWKSALTKEN